MFYEPLGINPVGKVVRRLTPFARTADEKPLGYKELREISEMFDTRFDYEQLLSVPFGVLSRALLRRPQNRLTRLAFRLDRAIDERMPPLRPLYRHVTIHGRKPA